MRKEHARLELDRFLVGSDGLVDFPTCRERSALEEVQPRQARRNRERAFDRGTRVAQAVVLDLQVGFARQRINVLCILREYFVEQPVGLLPIAGLGRHRGEPQTGRRETVRILRDAFEQCLGRRGLTRADVILGEGDLSVGSGRRLGNHLERALGVGGSTRSDIERCQSAIGDNVLRLLLERRLECLERLGTPVVGPIEVGECETRFDGFGVELDRAAERSLRGRGIALDLLDGCKHRVRRSPVGVALDRQLDLRDGAVEIAARGQRVTLQQVRLDAVGIGGERLVGAAAGFFKLIRREQQMTGLELRLQVFGHQIGGAHILLIRVLRLVYLHVGIGQLEARFAKARIGLDRIAVLDDRLAIFRLRDVLVAAAHRLALGDLGVFGARAGEKQQCDDRGQGSRT